MSILVLEHIKNMIIHGGGDITKLKIPDDTAKLIGIPLGSSVNDALIAINTKK